MFYISPELQQTSALFHKKSLKTRESPHSVTEYWWTFFLFSAKDYRDPRFKKVKNFEKYDAYSMSNTKSIQSV